MTDKIKPALTAKEWGNRCYDYGRKMCIKIGGSLAITGGHPAEEYPEPHGELVDWHELPPLIALANAALSDSDPRKITRKWIDDLDWVIQNGAGGDWLRSGEDVLRPIRDALESYLPPETL